MTLNLEISENWMFEPAEITETPMNNLAIGPVEENNCPLSPRLTNPTKACFNDDYHNTEFQVKNKMQKMLTTLQEHSHCL